MFYYKYIDEIFFFFQIGGKVHINTLNPARCLQQLRHPNNTNTQVTVNATANS